MQARKLEASTPYILEIQNFIANRLWALGLQDEATEVYERAYKQALAHIPKGFKGQITWGEVDNRPFLRLAHGTLLGLMRRRDKAKGGEAAMALAKQMLAWCPMDNIGVRFLLGDIALIQGDHQAAMKEYLAGAPNSPALWYQAALIAFREGDYVAACTYLRRGIASNPYIAEGLTGRTVLSEHLYWHASNVHGPDWAVDYLDSAACDWAPQEIDFVDWVFNASPVLKERAEMMALHEGMTYERDAEKRTHPTHSGLWISWHSSQTHCPREWCERSKTGGEWESGLGIAHHFDEPRRHKRRSRSRSMTETSPSNPNTVRRRVRPILIFIICQRNIGAETNVLFHSRFGC